MSYKRIINNNATDVHNSAIATKILQHISRVRDNRDEMQARRFIWELIQNAKDAKYPNVPVRIKVELFEDKLTFSHTGRPFRVKNILSIINQVSSKLPDDEETTGQFGTGFVTTHLLSEKVMLTSICQDSYDNEELSAKKFEILLDRSGSNQEEIMAAVNNAIHIISDLDNSQDILFEENDFNTTFTYQFEQEHCFQTAKQGLDDLKYSIIYALAFVRGIDEVVVINHTENSHTIYEVESRNQFSNSNTLEEFTVCEHSDSTTRTHQLLLSSSQGIQLAAPMKNSDTFLPIHEYTPRLFCDFPLIGSEGFPFPVVINSRDFQPNETRSSIAISSNAESSNSNINKKLMLDALSLYEEIIAFSPQLEDVYLMCRFSKLITRSDFDETWYTDSILSKIYHILSEYPIVKTKEGYAELQHVIFPKSNDKNPKKALANLVKIFDMTTYQLPENVVGWNHALYHLPVQFQANLKVYTLKRLIEMKDNLLKISLNEDSSTVTFLNTIYNAIIEDASLSKDFLAGNIYILPDQEKEMQLHPVNDIFLDPGIDEYIKCASDELDNVSYTNTPHTHIRRHLLHKEFELQETHAIQTYNLNDFAHNISNKIYPNVREYNLPYVTAASDYLIACHSSDLYYNTLNKIRTLSIPYKKIESEISTTIWTKAIICNFTHIEELIANIGTLKNLQEKYFTTENESITFIKDFYQCIGLNSLKSNLRSIFLNQKGDFCYIRHLKSEDKLSSDLKYIIYLLSLDKFTTRINNCYDFLLDTRVGFTLDQKYTADDIAYGINTGITRALNCEGGLNKASDSICEAATLLLSYIDEHDEEGERFFPAFYHEDNRMKLLTTRAASSMSKKLKKVDELLKNGNLTLEDLEKIINEHNDSSSDFLLNSEYFYEDDSCEIDFNLFDQGDGNIRSFEYRESLARKVGRIGEILAYQVLLDRENPNYIVARTDSSTTYDYNTHKVEISLADTEYYKQAGYDIIKTISYPENDEENKVYYYEVKSTIRKNTVHSIHLSYQQFLSASKHGEHYTLMRMCLSCDFELKYHLEINDILSSIRNNIITPSGGIEFFIN